MAQVLKINITLAYQLTLNPYAMNNPKKSKIQHDRANVDLHLNNLYLRYFFNRDIGDISRANYWLSRIKEREALNKH